MVIPAVSFRTVRGATPFITVTEGRVPDEKGLRNLVQQAFAGCRQAGLKVEGVRSSRPETGSFIWMMMFCTAGMLFPSSVFLFATSQADRKKAVASAAMIFFMSSLPSRPTL